MTAVTEDHETSDGSEDEGSATKNRQSPEEHAAAAAERFTKWDTDKDGLLSREEYLKQGK